MYDQDDQKNKLLKRQINLSEFCKLVLLNQSQKTLNFIFNMYVHVQVYKKE